MDWRVYFHKRNGDDPVVWSVDQGDQTSEMHVQWFSFVGCMACSRSNLQPAPGAPSGWIELTGVRAEFGKGGVTFTPEPGSPMRDSARRGGEVQRG